MTDRDFIYWLQGFFELSCGEEYNLHWDTLKIILKHIELVESGRDKDLADSFLVGTVSSIASVCKALEKNYTDENSIFTVDILHKIIENILVNVTREAAPVITTTQEMYSISGSIPQETQKIENWDVRNFTQGYVDVFEGGGRYCSSPPIESKNLFTTC
jgi:hypothetical protein